MPRISTVSPQQLTRFADAIDQAGDARHIAESFRDASSDYLYLGAHINDDMVGVLEGGTGRDFTANGGPAATYPPPHAYASLMYVLVDHRRTGIGKALLAAFADVAAQAGCSFIKLLVDESDGNSTGRRALFAAAGFTAAAETPR